MGTKWTDDKTIKDNKTLLTEFCTEQKNNGVDTTQLKKFYNFYLEKQILGREHLISPNYSINGLQILSSITPIYKLRGEKIPVF